MEWSNGDLVWFDPGMGHPLPGEIQEVHRAAQIIIVQAVINGKPWQKGGTPSPSPSLNLLSPHIKRRQRMPSMNDKELQQWDKLSDEERERKKIDRQRRLRYRYPQTVKRLSLLCSDALAKNPQTFTLGLGEGSLCPRQDLGKTGVEDMTQLEDLHEASLLWNLKLRYDCGLIYTYAGSILIAVNPYKMFPDSYGLEMAKKYSAKPIGALPPHLFAIGAAAHAQLPTPQVVVISGESGSGKTESTKLVMQYLAAVVPGGGSASAVITEQILEAAPLLEAFGNARTVRNDNSSRFGKYLEVYFKSGAIIGAKITQYLLEKSRIVTQAPNERNYHVFYELLGALNETERARYGLLEADKYFYLNQGTSDCAPGRVDWASLQGAMQVLGISENEQEGIVRVLAAVLHMGNVYFHRRQLRHGQEGVELGSDAEVKWAAHLLQIPSEYLLRTLTTKITETRSERLHTPLTIDQALDARDAFAKALYSALFNWLVLRINSIIHKGGTHDAHRISILDIFGFEDLGDNSFEQLCINYANESLQLYFNKHVFKLEQAEYARERLEWTPLEWEDNLPVIHLLAKKPVGILHLLDDESNFPRATDITYLEKCHYNHALNELYSRPRIGAQEFGIMHYAGQVWYNVEGFLEKNRDALRPDVVEMLSESQEPLVYEMTKQLKAQRELNRSLPRGTNGRFITMKPRTPTVAARFSDSLQQLLQSMAKCNPWFVRCIKPNNDKQALRMDMPCVLQQLRYLGMLDTIKIRQTGYPVRLRFQHFVERYRHMLKTPIPRGTPYRDLCRLVLDALQHTNTEGPDFQLGATRVFLREALHRVLENSRADRLKNAAVVIQKNVRAMLERRRMQRKKRGAIVIQKAWRGHHQQKQYRKLKKGVVKAQALYRGRIVRRNYEKMKNDLKRRRDFERSQKEKAHQRMQREHQERSQIIHLDVPAELAFIFSKVENWTPVHGDRHLVKVVGTVPGPPMAPELPTDLDQFAFGKFSSVYCNGKKLQPRKDPISSPFLSRAAARDQDYQDSLAIFKLILRWTGDSTLDGNKDKILADYIVNKGLASKGLRDEILVQLCNQVYLADEHQSQRIWQLMSHCLSSFQPGAPFSKYLMKFIADNAPMSMKDLLLKKLLRNSNSHQTSVCRIFPPTWLEWRAGTRQSDIALGLTLPDGVMQTVAVDSWTTCEEAGSLAISSLQGIPTMGWTVSFEDGSNTDTCGLDYILDLVAEKELCPAFPSIKNDLLRSGSGRKMPTTPQSPMTPNSPEPSSPKRPQVPPPEPPRKSRTPESRTSPEMLVMKSREKVEKEEIKAEYTRTDMMPTRKQSHELLSRSSALNERYFEVEKSRSRSLDDLLNSDSTETPPIPEPEPLVNLGLSKSKLNERYHSAERLAPLKQPQPKHLKQPYVGKRTGNSSKQMERSEMIVRSSAMSDTSEAPSLASHVRRVRVPSQASDVDQFLDDLFSPVLDGSLDELSDARSLAASIRGGGDDDLSSFCSVPDLDDDLLMLGDVNHLCYSIQGGGDDENEDEIENGTSNGDGYDASLDEYITDLFQPIFLNENIRNLGEKDELAEAIKGGGANHGGGSSSLMSPLAHMNSGSIMLNGVSAETFMANLSVPPDVDPILYQQQMQRAFLESAMAQNIQIQQQLIAQNQALQTLLKQQSDTSPPVSQAVSPSVNHSEMRKTSFKFRSEMSSSYTDVMRTRKTSSDSAGSGNLIPPPPPPPLPPPLECRDPMEVRPFIDPYGRAKTVRIGKWRWPPPQGATQEETAENYIQFKMRQNQRKSTPKSQSNNSNSSNESPNGSSAGIEWEEYDVVDNSVEKPKYSSKNESNNSSPAGNGAVSKIPRRTFGIGAERPSPGSVGKLKLSTEMRQRLEQVTAGHSVRSTTSNRSDKPEKSPGKLEDARRMMLEQQLGGALNGAAKTTEMVVSVKTQVQRMEASKRPPPPPWPSILPPAPTAPAPPPPIRPPTSSPPAPPTAPGNFLNSSNEKIPSFLQRQERDTFGVKDHYNHDSWGRAEAAKVDMVYETSFKKEVIIDRERSRSRSRDRENFSESVWDRSEVEGPGSDRDKEKDKQKERERQYELSLIQRERDSHKVYQPNNNNSRNSDREKSKSTTPTERATFKTHMTSKNAYERERKSSISTLASNKDKYDDTEMVVDDFVTPAIPAPVPAPPMLKSPASACLTYNRVAWKLRVRKEVFRPNEPMGPPAALDLLFAQVASDIFGITSSLRISPQERRQAVSLMSSHGITAENVQGQVRTIVKRHLVEMARGWPLYFARLFAVSGSPQFPDISILAVSHNGIFLARKEKDYLAVVKTITFNDLQGAVTLPRPAALQLNLKNGNRYALHAARAQAIQNMVQSFLQEFKMSQSKTSTISSGVRQAAATLNVPIERLESTPTSPQQNGIHNEKNHVVNNNNLNDDHMIIDKNSEIPTQSQNGFAHHQPHRKNSFTQPDSLNMSREESPPSTQNSAARHTLLQFAMQHFRNDNTQEDPSKTNRSEKRPVSGRIHADLVKWQGTPLKAPLLRLPPDLAPLALECFECILRYCGDLPPDPELTEVKCVYSVLMHCHKHLILRDEVYCQLMKQTTANRSPCPDSSQRAWRLLSILAAYFGCSDALKPYLTEHLTTASSDRRKSCHGTASVCLTNLRKTARCGGRKNVPSVEEVTAVSAGRSARRQIYRLPGGAERVVNTRCSTVVADVISELCSLLGIESEAEQQEFSLYCIVQGDAFTMPLSADEYILDVTTELLKTGQPFYLIFCRSVWHYPLKRDPAPTPLYIEVLFNQVAPDYLEGLLLEIPTVGVPSPEYVRDMARIAAILHRAADLNHIPVMKEIKFLLPKPALALRELRPAQWVSLVQAAWGSVAPLSPLQCKAQFLSVLSAWPLFGSSFFAVKRVWGEEAGIPDDPSQMWRELILALNRRGVLFLDLNTHETLQHWPFTEVISTRKVRSEDGALFLDMKVGNLLQQNVIRVQTEQAHEISRLVRQYITMAQATQTQRERRE